MKTTNGPRMAHRSNTTATPGASEDLRAARTERCDRAQSTAIEKNLELAFTFDNARSQSFRSLKDRA